MSIPAMKIRRGGSHAENHRYMEPWHYLARSPIFQPLALYLLHDSGNFKKCAVCLCSRTLPPKDPQEDKRHLRAFEKMMVRSKHREAQRHKTSVRAKTREEKEHLAALKYWEGCLSGNWEKKKHSRRTKSLWDQYGLPHRVRGRIWKLAIGNSAGIEPRNPSL
jgi:hypothetical protein